MALPRLAFYAALVMAGFGYGYLSYRNHWFPQSLITAAMQGWHSIKAKAGEERPWYYIPTTRKQTVVMHQPQKLSPGLTLYTGVGTDNVLFARVVAPDGAVVNTWNLDWFRIWPDAKHLDGDEIPKEAPGASIIGMMMTDDGGLVFNYEGLGLVRVDAAGDVVWRLPYRTHHSVFRDDDGNFWLPGLKPVHKPMPGLPLYIPPFKDYSLIKVSPEGEILLEKSVAELLHDNGLPGLLYLAARDGMEPDMTGDVLHMNDVKVFPASLRAGFLQPGDVMISLRNINAVLIFNQTNWKLKHLSIGKVVRQHDPDFIDGNTISIFDNNQVGSRENGAQSRIVIESLPDGATSVAFQGTPEHQFYTDIMGKHQTMPNGNRILLEARAGRIWEVDAQGGLVWELNNIVADGMLGALTDVTRLSPEVTVERLKVQRAEVVRRKLLQSAAEESR